MYIFNFIFPLFYYVILSIASIPLNKKKPLYLTGISIYMFIFLSCFNYKSFPDVYYYNVWFDYLKFNSVSDFYEQTLSHIEYGYSYFCKLLTYISSDSRIIYIARSLIFVFCFVYSIKKHSANYFLSILFLFIFYRIDFTIYCKTIYRYCYFFVVY